MTSSDPQVLYREAGVRFNQNDFSGALQILDTLLVANPDAAPLHWHRARCLLALQQPTEAAQALDTTLRLTPDFVPALLARVNLAQEEGEMLDVLPLLQRAVNAEPGHARAQFLLAEAELAAAEAGSLEEAEALLRLDQSLLMDANQAEAWACRAESRLSRALLGAHVPDSTETVRDVYGMHYDRTLLEGALSDFQEAAQREDNNLFDRRIALIADKLGHYPLAAQALDRVLARMPADAPARQLIEQERDHYAQGQSAARQNMLKNLHTLRTPEPGERSLHDDMSQAVLHSITAQVRDGAELSDVLENLFHEPDPDELIAISIAHDIHSYANEPDPGLVEVDAQNFPAFQRRHVRNCLKRLTPLGYFHLADVEAVNLGARLGRRVLIGLFSHPEYGTAAAFSIRPKWPGWRIFLAMLLSRQWKTWHVLECITCFEDGHILNSRIKGPDVFDDSAIESIQFERLPADAKPEEVAESHIALAQTRIAQGAQVKPVQTLSAIEQEWRRSNALKADYRRRIGYVTEAELRSMLGDNYTRLADKIRRQLAQLDDSSPSPA